MTHLSHSMDMASSQSTNNTMDVLGPEMATDHKRYTHTETDWMLVLIILSGDRIHTSPHHTINSTLPNTHSAFQTPPGAFRHLVRFFPLTEYPRQHGQILS